MRHSGEVARESHLSRFVGEVRMWKTGFLALATALSLGCAGEKGLTGAAMSTAPPSSGGAVTVRGVVLRGPLRPGPSRPGRTERDQPFSAVFTLKDESGSTVGRFETGADGAFRLSLMPGAYTVHPDEDAPLMMPLTQSARLEVPGQGVAQVELHFDTGMR